MFKTTHFFFFFCGQRILDEKRMDLEEAQGHIEALERNTANQMTEVTIYLNSD